VRVDGPLAAYAESLVRIIERDFDAAHPGHRDRIDDPSRRAATILDHHRHRTRRVLDVLADEGPATAGEVSAALFGDLSEIHVLHGPGEAFAHLDHLADAGIIEPDGTAYRLIDPEPDVDALFPTTPRRRGRRLGGVVREIREASVRSPPPHRPRRKLFLRDGVSTDVKRDTLLAVALPPSSRRRALGVAAATLDSAVSLGGGGFGGVEGDTPSAGDGPGDPGFSPSPGGDFALATQPLCYEFLRAAAGAVSALRVPLVGIAAIVYRDTRSALPALAAAGAVGFPIGLIWWGLATCGSVSDESEFELGIAGSDEGLIPEGAAGGTGPAGRGEGRPRRRSSCSRSSS